MATTPSSPRAPAAPGPWRPPPATAATPTPASPPPTPASSSGLWPGLAHDANGEPGVIYRDAHYGTLQHDDLYRADLEYAIRSGGSWTQEAIDIGEGAGDYGELVFDGEGRAVAVYAITIIAQEDDRHGVWAARREHDGTWDKVMLHLGSIDENVAAGVDPTTGEIVVAYYSKADLAAKVHRLVDPDAFTESASWTQQTVGDAQYDEGRYVALDFAPDGRVALAYHRCKLITAGDGGCDFNDEAVIFALETDTGDFRTHVVHEAGRGTCGQYTSLGIDSAGTAWIGFRCTDDSDGFAQRPVVASGVVPP